MKPVFERWLAPVLLMLAAVSAGCGAMRHDARASGTQVLSKIQIERLAFVPLSAATCNAEVSLTCDIQVMLTEDGRYCVVAAPKVHVKRNTGPGQQKKVVWKLSTSTLDGKPLLFHDDSGIVIAHQSESKFVEKGGRGDGNVGNSDPDKYFLRVNRNKPALAEASYLPVVMWGDGGKEELCAAIDPRIINQP